jgi:hypothetical protein
MSVRVRGSRWVAVPVFTQESAGVGIAYGSDNILKRKLDLTEQVL